ncbi:MAG: hypothetical protein WC450_04400 [Candidatus Omnitrophota bacterium]
MMKYILLIFSILLYGARQDAYAEAMQEGFGTANLPDSSVYEGEFKDGLFHGKGKLTWRNGDTLEGEFKNGLINGKGKHIYHNNSVYEGTFIDGLPDGQGIVECPNCRYTGQFKNGVYEGQGELEYPGLSKYEGDFKLGLPNGYGVITYVDGSILSGLFSNGVVNGQGKRVDGQGTVYEGELKNSIPEGKGVAVFKNGGRYEGEFRKGAISKGLFIIEGITYEGEFNNWTYNGKGKLDKTHVYSYEGEFLDGQFHGYGKLIYPTGDIYEGQFLKGQLEKGILSYANGNKYDGVFQDNKFNGFGIYTSAQGNIYDGEFKDGKFDGKGKRTFRDKDGNLKEQVGLWKAGVFQDNEKTSNENTAISDAEKKKHIQKKVSQMAEKYDADFEWAAIGDKGMLYSLELQKRLLKGQRNPCLLLAPIEDVIKRENNYYLTANEWGRDIYFQLKCSAEQAQYVLNNSTSEFYDYAIVLNPKSVHKPVAQLAGEIDAKDAYVIHHASDIIVVKGDCLELLFLEDSDLNMEDFLDNKDGGIFYSTTPVLP